jgi:hypothetical protein
VEKGGCEGVEKGGCEDVEKGGKGRAGGREDVTEEE